MLRAKIPLGNDGKSTRKASRDKRADRLVKDLRERAAEHGSRAAIGRTVSSALSPRGTRPIQRGLVPPQRLRGSRVVFAAWRCCLRILSPAGGMRFLYPVGGPSGTRIAFPQKRRIKGISDTIIRRKIAPCATIVRRKHRFTSRPPFTTRATSSTSATHTARSRRRHRPLQAAARL